MPLLTPNPGPPDGHRELLRWASLPVAMAVVLALGVAAAALLTLRTLRTVNGDLLQHNVRALVSASELDALALRKAAADRAYLLTGETDFVLDLWTARAEFSEKLAQLRAATRTERGRVLTERVEEASERYADAVDDLVRLRGASDETGALRWFGSDVQPRLLELQSTLNEYVLHKERLLQQDAARTMAAGQRAARIALLVAVGALALTIGLAWTFGTALARRLQAMRQAAQTAEASARAREEVMSMASHDLRTPLSTLVLHLDALHLDLRRRKLDDPSVRKRLEGARRQIDSQVELLERLLDASRIEAGKLDLQSQAGVDLSELTRRVVDRLLPIAERAGCHVAFEGPIPVSGTWDPTRLEQVLTNVLSNAIKYSAGRPVEVEVTEYGDTARVRIRDHGSGMTPEQARAIFERFETAATRGGPAGAGLGLWIARRIVEALAGRIDVDTAPGKGTTVVIALPRGGGPPGDQAGATPD